MKTVQISLNSIDKVKSFVNSITQFDFDFDLISGRYVIDAKSIMGIFSLDLSKPIELAIHSEANIDEIMEVLKPYLAEYSRYQYSPKPSPFGDGFFIHPNVTVPRRSLLSFRWRSASSHRFFPADASLIF